MAMAESFSQEIEDNKINERIEAELLLAVDRGRPPIEDDEPKDLSNTKLTLNKEELGLTESTSTGAIPKRGFSYLSNISLSPQSNLNNCSLIANKKSILRTGKPESSTTQDIEAVNLTKPRCLSNQSIFQNNNKSVLRDKNVSSSVINPNINLENRAKFRTSLQFSIKEKVNTKLVSLEISNEENVNQDTSTHSLECNTEFRNTSEKRNRNNSLVKACKVLRSNLEKQKCLQSSEKVLKTSGENITENSVSLQSDNQNCADHLNTSKLAQRNAKIIHTQLLLRGLLDNNTGFQSAIQPALREELLKHRTSPLRDSDNQTGPAANILQKKESSEEMSNANTISNYVDERTSQPSPTIKNVEKRTSNPQSRLQDALRNSSDNITSIKNEDNLSESKSSSIFASSRNELSVDENQNSVTKTKNSLGIKNAPGKLKPEVFSFLNSLPKKGENTVERKNLVPTAIIHAEALHLVSVKDENREPECKSEDFPEPSAPPYSEAEDYCEAEISNDQRFSDSRPKISQKTDKSEDKTVPPALPSRPPPDLPEANNIDSKKKSLSISMEKKTVGSNVEKKEKVKKNFAGLKLSANLISKPLPLEPQSDQQNQNLTPPPLPPLPLKLVNKYKNRFSGELDENNTPVEVAKEANSAETQKKIPLYPSFEAILAVENPDETNESNKGPNKDLIKPPQNTIHAEDSEGYLLDTGKDFLRQSPPTLPPRKVSQPCMANTKLIESPSIESQRSSPNSDLDSWMNSIERPCLPQKLKTTQRSLSCNSLVQSFREMSFAMWNAPAKEKRISMDSFHKDKPLRSISRESITKVQTSATNIVSKPKIGEIPEAQPEKVEVSLPVSTDSQFQLLRYPWYHDVDAREGQRRLRDFLDQNGAFLIRPSSKKTNEIQHTACMVYSGRIINMHIRKKSNGQYALGFEREGEPTFSSICELIKYYQDIPFTGQSNSIKSFRACFRVTPPKF